MAGDKDWNPRDYSVDDAMNDLLVKEGSNVTDVAFTEDGGVIKEHSMSDGSYRVSGHFPTADGGYVSVDQRFDKNGNSTGIHPHPIKHT